MKNENGTLIFCNNVDCPQIIIYEPKYLLIGFCSWTCKRIQEHREMTERQGIIRSIPEPPVQYTRVSRNAKLPALDPRDCTKEFEENEKN